MATMWMWEMCKAWWMGIQVCLGMDEVLMGGTWTMGAWDWNIVLETWHLLVGVMFWGLGCLHIKTFVHPSPKTCHVLKLKLPMHSNHGNSPLKLGMFWCALCFKIHITHMSKFTLGCFKMNDIFMTCCWNNIGEKLNNILVQ
jgi:hypothetical protein